MYCIIDIGSNTIRLVVYSVENGKISSMLNKKNAAGLAGYVNKKNCLNKKGIAKTIEILNEYKKIIDMLPNCEVFPFATASLRNLSNSDKVIDSINRCCGFNVRILSGREEALFDYHGAVRTVKNDSGIVADIGGGSTEIVYYSNKEAHIAESLPIGSLNLYKKFVKGILPEKKEIKRMEDEITRQLSTLSIPIDLINNQSICGVGGTARTALTLYKSLNNSKKNISEYNCSFFNDLIIQFCDSPKKITEAILQNSPERIHTIIPGILIMKVISQTYHSKTIVTSSYGVREGYLFHILEERGEIIV